MPVQFVPASDINRPLKVALGLAGASGTGKTLSGLRVARGMAREVAGDKGARFSLADTENLRGLAYRDDFPDMNHYDFSAKDESGNLVGFTVDRWHDVIDAAERSGVAVLMFDSFSHSWEGVGGVLARQAEILDRLTRGDESRRDGLSQLAWAQVKPDYRRLVEHMIRTPVHLIVCHRAKRVIVDPRTKKNVRDTKLRRADVPWDIAGDADLIFEMTAQVVLDPKSPGCPVHMIKAPDAVRPYFDDLRPMDESLGRDLIGWSRGEESARLNRAALDAAKEEARKGKDAFVRHWKALSDADQVRVRSIADECQRLAAEADQRAADRERGPFREETPPGDAGEEEGA